MKHDETALIRAFDIVRQSAKIFVHILLKNPELILEIQKCL